MISNKSLYKLSKVVNTLTTKDNMWKRYDDDYRNMRFNLPDCIIKKRIFVVGKTVFFVELNLTIDLRTQKEYKGNLLKYKFADYVAIIDSVGLNQQQSAYNAGFIKESGEIIVLPTFGFPIHQAEINRTLFLCKCVINNNDHTDAIRECNCLNNYSFGNGDYLLGTDGMYHNKKIIPYPENFRLLGWNIFNEDFIIYSAEIIYNVTKQHVIYSGQDIVSMVDNIIFTKKRKHPHEHKEPPCYYREIYQKVTMTPHVDINTCDTDYLKREIKTMQDKINQYPKMLECAICMTETRERVAYSCGHVNVCVECDSSKIKECPVCKTKITQRFNIIMP